MPQFIIISSLVFIKKSYQSINIFPSMTRFNTHILRYLQGSV